MGGRKRGPGARMPGEGRLLKWTASRFSDQTLRDCYAELAVEWQKAAAAYEQSARAKRP